MRGHLDLLSSVQNEAEVTNSHSPRIAEDSCVFLSSLLLVQSSKDGDCFSQCPWRMAGKCLGFSHSVRRPPLHSVSVSAPCEHPPSVALLDPVPFHKSPALEMLHKEHGFSSQERDLVPEMPSTSLLTLRCHCFLCPAFL